MVVGWLMLWLVTTEVKGSYPSSGVVEPLRPTSGLLAQKAYESPTCQIELYKWLTCIGLGGLCTFFMGRTS
jgi:hypothetical protein